MITRWIDNLTSVLTPENESGGTNRGDVERVCALLLVEIAHADHVIESSEQDSIRAALRKAFTLDDLEIETILENALRDVKHTVSLHEHVQLINAQFNQQQKRVLIEQMWRVAVADGDIDKYEEYTIRRLCELLHVKHRDFIQSKHRVVGQ